MEDILEKLSVIFLEICGIEREQFAEEVSLRDDVGVNSVTLVEILAKVEQDFEIEIDDKDYDMTKFETIADIISFIQSKLK